MDGILTFASSHFVIMQPVFECFSSPRLMRSPWEIVNRHGRWNCHISLAPLFWLSSEITQCGFSSAQGNHEFSTHYTYPLHLFYCAPYSKWHLIVWENICSYISFLRPNKMHCHLQSNRKIFTKSDTDLFKFSIGINAWHLSIRGQYPFMYFPKRNLNVHKLPYSHTLYDTGNF